MDILALPERVAALEEQVASLAAEVDALTFAVFFLIAIFVALFLFKLTDSPLRRFSAWIIRKTRGSSPPPPTSEG